MSPEPRDISPDHPEVAIHPPFFYLAAVIVACGLNLAYPLPIFQSLVPRLCGLVLAIAGLAVIATGRGLMKAHGTNIMPTKPTMVIIESGPYRYSRNPLYLALSLTYGGLTLLINTWWGLIFLPAVLLSMHFLVVLREERYLENKFGDVYRSYRQRVRRYL